MSFIVALSPEEWRARFGSGDSLPRTAVTIGTFDGVHRGHQAILRAVLKYARRTQTLATALTFHPHPLRVLRPEQAPPMLMTLPQRLRCFAELGLDAALVLKFDVAFSSLSAEEFVRRILLETLAARVVLPGEAFRFGYRHGGNVGLLTELGRCGNASEAFDVVVIPPVIYRGAVVSSTAIRQAIREGAVSRARRLLGRPYELEGVIQRGQGIGRRLVVPTLNLATHSEILPANGVYATETCVGGMRYRSVTNVGIRPTLGVSGNSPVTVESHLFDFSNEVTEGPMVVRFHTRIRDERKFSGLATLCAQVLRDAARVKRFFSRIDRKSSLRNS
jgi:riboflavin kinase / FMN adenylyltransferase